MPNSTTLRKNCRRVRAPASRVRRYDPAPLVGGLDGGRARAERFLDLRRLVRPEGPRLSPAPIEPAVEEALIRIGLALIGIGVAGPDGRVVPVGPDELVPVAGGRLRDAAAQG